MKISKMLLQLSGHDWRQAMQYCSSLPIARTRITSYSSPDYCAVHEQHAFIRAQPRKHACEDTHIPKVPLVLIATTWNYLDT
jgi:hypothetical protein